MDLLSSSNRRLLTIIGTVCWIAGACAQPAPTPSTPPASPSIPASQPAASVSPAKAKSRVPASRTDTFLPPIQSPYLTPAWPARVTSNGRTTVIRELGLPASRLFCASGFFNSLLAGGVESEEARLAKVQDAADISAARVGLGLRPTDPIKLEGDNATPVRGRAENPSRKPRAAAAGEPDSVQTFSVLTLQEQGPDQPHQTPAINRTTFAWYVPINPAGQGTIKGRAVIMLMPGMFGTPEQIIDPLVKHLRLQGYGVLRMLSQPSRFTEEVVITINTQIEADWKAEAERAAVVIDNRLAEVAYSAEAALKHVHSLDTDAAKLPHVIMGISGGAISLPPVVARMPRQWNAAVIMGGSADFWLTLSRSNYNDFIGAVKTNWLPESVNTAEGSAARQAFDEAYLSHARLDPYHTIAALKSTPVLAIQGSLDRAVPSALGDVLWSRLGEPEAPSARWKTPLSHETLFLTLPARFAEITAWIDGVIALPATVENRSEPTQK